MSAYQAEDSYDKGASSQICAAEFLHCRNLHFSRRCEPERQKGLATQCKAKTNFHFFFWQGFCHIQYFQLAKSLPRKVKVGFSFALGSQPFCFFLSQIGALLGVLSQAAIMKWCTKIDKYQVCTCASPLIRHYTKKLWTITFSMRCPFSMQGNQFPLYLACKNPQQICTHLFIKISTISFYKSIKPNLHRGWLLSLSWSK